MYFLSSKKFFFSHLFILAFQMHFIIILTFQMPLNCLFNHKVFI